MQEIRSATPSDKDAIIRLMQQHMSEKGLEVQADVVALTVEYVLNSSAYTTFLAEDTSQNTIGIVSVVGLPNSGLDVPDYFLENLYVDPSYRDASVGKHLIEHAVKMCSPSIATSVAVSEMQTVGDWFVDQGFQPCDSEQAASITDALEHLPLKLGSEGTLQYYIHRRQ